MKRLLTLIAFAVASSAPSALAQPRWTLLRSETLTVVGDQSPRTLRDVATEIEQFRRVVSELVGTTRPTALPTVVYVFGNRRGMEPYLPLYNGRPTQSAGLYVPDVDVQRILLSVEDRDVSTRIAYHEYTHLLVANAVRGMPVWLGEGLAEYFSTYRLTMGGRGAEAGHAIAPHILLLRERFVPIVELLDTGQSSKLYNDDDRRTIFYAESWALTHYILSQLPNGRTAIDTYVTRVNAGASPADAVQAAFGMTPGALEVRLRQYVQRAVFSMMRYEMTSRVVAAPATPPRTLNPVEVDAWLGDLQRAVRGEAAAAARIEAAAAKAPDTAIAQLALGRLRAGQQRSEEARAALARAAALAPDDFMMQLAHGMWLAPAANAEVVASLRRATALNPESPDAHASLALNLMSSPATRAEARTAIERAMQLAPGRLDYVLQLADIYLLDDLLAPARSLLTAVAAVKSDERASAGATTRLAAIAEREQALARMAAARAERAVGAAAARTAGSPASPEGRSAVDPVSMAADYTATPLTHATTGERLTLMMRRPKPGEQRVFATLTHIECRSGAEIRFHVVDGARTIVATASRFPDVELIAFKAGQYMLACGRRSPADQVAFTWRPNSQQPGGIAGAAVAIEFLPDDYGPIK